MAVFQVSKPTMYFELCNITYNIIQVLKIHAQAALMGSWFWQAMKPHHKLLDMS